MTNNLSKGTFAFVLSLTVAAITMLQPASARDRPGTPNQESLTACGYSQNLKPTLCGSFINTASEKVRFEMEAKRNNVPISVQTECFVPVRGGPGLNGRVGCYDPLVEVQNPGTSSTDPHTGKNVPDRLVLSFKIHEEVEFGTQYCVYFRARRTSDSVVSEVWSNWACVQTQDAPKQRPSLPEFSVKFLGTQILNNPAKAAPGEKEEIIPRTMEISYPANEENVGCSTKIFPLGKTTQLDEDR